MQKCIMGSNHFTSDSEDGCEVRFNAIAAGGLVPILTQIIFLGPNSASLVYTCSPPAAIALNRTSHPSYESEVKWFEPIIHFCTFFFI